MKLWRFLSRKKQTDKNCSMGMSQRNAQVSAPALEPLEPRLLLSADLLGGSVLDQSLVVQDAEQPVIIESLSHQERLAEEVAVSGPNLESAQYKVPDLPGLYLEDPISVDRIAGQVFYLDFDGAEDVVYDGPVTVGPFDIPAFQVSDELDQQERAIIDQVLVSLRETFAGSGVIFSTEQPAFGTEYSTIYVGGDHSAFAECGSFWGIAEDIDLRNHDASESGFVFSENALADCQHFDPAVLRLAEVISHEAGHLLGYAHDTFKSGQNPPGSALNAVAYAVAEDAPVHQWIAINAALLYDTQFPDSTILDYIAASKSPGDNYANWLDDSFDWGDHCIVEGAHDEDATGLGDDVIGDGYFQHFVAGGDGSELTDGLWDYDSAYTKAQAYWDGTDYYSGQNSTVLGSYTNDREESYYILGRIAHLLGDMAVPAHTHNDPHWPWPFDDAYESAVSDSDYYQMWDYGHAVGDINLYGTLEDLFRATADYTEEYDSGPASSFFNNGVDDVGYNGDDEDGIVNSGRHRPDLVDRHDGFDASEIMRLANDLLPWAMEQTAALFRLFYNAVDTISPTVSWLTSFGNTEDTAIQAPSTFMARAQAEDTISGYDSDGFRFYLDQKTDSGWDEEIWVSDRNSGNEIVTVPAEGLYRIRATVEDGAGNLGETPEGYFYVENSADVEFVWQRVRTVSDAAEIPVCNEYVVKVTAGEAPSDPSTFVYPYFNGNPMYDAVAIQVEDLLGNEITDEATLRQVLSLARNAALYRQMGLISGDQVPTLSLTDGFTEVPTTDPASFFFGLIEIGGGTDTSFGYDYPDSLVFPSQYAEGDGDARLVDWTEEHSWIALLETGNVINYFHAIGIADESQRQDVYIELLHHMVLQDGVDDIRAEMADAVYSLLVQMQDVAELGETASKVADIVNTAAQYSGFLEAGLREAFRLVTLSKSDLVNMASALHAPAHYTGIAAHLASPVASVLGGVLIIVGDGFTFGGDALGAIMYSIAVEEKAAEMLAAFGQSAFVGQTYDVALKNAWDDVYAEFEEDLQRDFWDRWWEEVKRETADRGGDYALDSVQVGLHATAAALALSGVGLLPAGIVEIVNLGISAVRLAYDWVIEPKLEHEEMQQQVVLASTLNYAWAEFPLQDAIANISATACEDEIMAVNWLISTELYQAAFVADQIFLDNSNWMSWVAEQLGNSEITRLREEYEGFRDRMISVMFGGGDVNPILNRLAGVPRLNDTYVGFVPPAELEELLRLAGVELEDAEPDADVFEGVWTVEMQDYVDAARGIAAAKASEVFQTNLELWEEDIEDADEVEYGPIAYYEEIGDFFLRHVSGDADAEILRAEIEVAVIYTQEIHLYEVVEDEEGNSERVLTDAITICGSSNGSWVAQNEEPIDKVIVNGTDAADNIVLDGVLAVNEVNAKGGGDHIYLSGYSGSSDTQGRSLIHGDEDDDWIYGGTGDDEIYGDAGADHIWGDDGVDTIRGGSEGDFIYGGDLGDYLYGDEGSDTIEGNAGEDEIEGNAGEDVIHGNEDADRISGGDGVDHLYGDDGDDWIWGNEQGDYISGGSQNDHLYGEAGGDTIHGGSGADYIEGNVGADEIYGDADDDEIHGNEDGDIIDGGSGNDEIYGEQGGDEIKGGAGFDVILGDSGEIEEGVSGYDDVPRVILSLDYDGADVINGGDDRDWIYGQRGDDTLEGGGGDDMIFGGFGVDYIYGEDQASGDSGSGNDYIEGERAGDHIWGNGGDDVIHGDGEDDHIYGNAGNDEIYGEAGDDTIDGGSGHDIILGDSGTIVGGIKNAGDPGTAVPEVGFSTEHAGNDIIKGGLDNDWIYGQGGNDILIGDTGSVGGSSTTADATAGSDHLYGQEGEDKILGGGGDDHLYGFAENASDSGSQRDIIVGDGGTITYDSQFDFNAVSQVKADSIFGGNDTIQGNEGDDIILAGAGGDTSVHGNAGDDIILGDNGTINLSSGVLNEISTTGESVGGADKLWGDSGDDGNDIIIGGPGGDEIHGEEDSDILIGDNGVVNGTTVESSVEGGDGVDEIYGQGGEDKILGGGDDDRLYGDKEAVGEDLSDKRDILVGDGGTIVYAGNRFEFNDIIGVTNSGQTQGGNDTLEGNDGNDVVLGGVGGDTSDQDDPGDDVILGDNGTVTLDNGHLVTVDTEGESVGGADMVKGGTGNDIIIGGPNGSSDNIQGNEGQDIILGDNGVVEFDVDGDLTTVDRVESAADGIGSDDTLSGNEDADIVLGGYGGDTIHGDDAGGTAGSQDGADILLGDNGRVLLRGHAPGVFETFNSAVDEVVTTDTSEDSGGGDTINGNAGNDIFLGGINNGDIDTLNGNAGDDVILGDNGLVDFETGDNDLMTIDLIQSQDFEVGGRDVISGNEGNDIAIGGTADDEIAGNSEADILIGDQGEIVYESGLVTDIASTDAQDSHGDVDTISGGSDDDIIIGGVAGDILEGNDGNDVLLGDEGALKYNRSASSGGDDDPETLDLIHTRTYDLGGQDTISGNAGDDIAMGGMEDDSIYGDDAVASGGASDGQDVLLGDNGEVILKGNQDGALTSFGSAIEKVNTTDTAEETGGVDTIEGNADGDVILGGVQGDTLYGDRGNPTTDSTASDGDDAILGDNGELDFDTGDGDLSTLDLVRSVPFSSDDETVLGGADTISGNAGSDVAIGSTAGDTIYGDDAAATAGTSDGQDTLVGDNAQIDLEGKTGEMHILDSAIKTIRTTDEKQNTGGEDTISGNAGGDVILGGVMGDLLHGDADTPDANDGDDAILGDNGRLDWGYHGDQKFAEIESDMTFDETLNTLDLVTTDLPDSDVHPGGRDTIFGGDGSDVVFGGTDSDLLYGDDGDAVGSDLNDDLLFGDHGRLYPQHSSLPGFNSENFFAIDTGDDDGGEGDRVYGEEGDDVMLGQQGDDRMFGGLGDDDMIGGHNVEAGIDELSDPAIAGEVNPAVNDVMDGGTGDDAMAGDNAVIWRRGDNESSRFRTLDGKQLYYPYDPIGTDDGNPDGAGAVTDGAQADPRGSVGRVITLLDHDSDTEAMVSARPWGIDLIAGNADYDLLFGQLGDDIVQGDGAIYPADDLAPGAGTVIVVFADTGDPDTSQTLFFEVFEASSDGDDYIEGNGGSDTLYGGLGQDDILGGSSDLFGLQTAQQRPDAGDTIYGGAATAARMQRNAFVGEEDLFVNLENRHARDSDMILGDNGRIFRPVGTSLAGAGTFLLFAYDQSGPETRIPGIVPRAIDLLDYIPGIGDAEEMAPVVNGAGDFIRGESGDDFLHGMMGQDVIYGDSDDDDIFGESQSDLLLGGTGEDGILGDDGQIFTCRNDNDSEPLYGIEGSANNELSDSLRTPGGIQEAKINVANKLKKTVNLEPFGVGAADIIYGGLGDDFLHGGPGDDAISGAEILDVESAGDNGTMQFLLSYGTPFTPDRIPVDTLGFNAKDPGTKSGKAEEFWLYDEYEPLRQIVVNVGTQATPDYRAFFLNFQAFTDAEDPVRTMIHDGNDAIFGDSGNDWLVGGTDQDHLYGGYGCDLLNADDNLETTGGLNEEPDVPAFAGIAYGTLSEDANQVGADTAYGGAGRDVLIANTGADRLIDWVGEFNSYLVPYAPFGQFSVSRSLQPHLRGYLYELSGSDGADPTRSDDVGSDPLRNGEPHGELGMVLQQDADWKDQTGAPNDPQAGNIPGGKRDVMESADFQGDSAGPLAAETGTWEVTAGKYVASSVDGGDATSIFFISDYQPSYMEIAATVNMEKDRGGRDANAYIIFDYISPTDFKFAGISLKEQKLQIGHRTEAGWMVDVQLPMNFKAGKDYRVLVALNGTTATLVVNNTTSLSYAFTDPLNEGLVALGVNNAVTRFDDVQALRLPPQITYESIEDFADYVPGSFTTQAGSWEIQDGWYTGVAVEDVALTTFSLETSPLAYVELESRLRTDSSAGLVFDYYSPEDFKFVMVMAETDQIVIGHRTSKGWFYDAVYHTEIGTDTDYDLKVCLKGTTVSVMLNDQAILGHVFNGIVTDGDFGMLSLYGLGVFDFVTVRTDDLLDF